MTKIELKPLQRSMMQSPDSFEKHIQKRSVRILVPFSVINRDHRAIHHIT